MLRTILSIAGRPGLYRLVNQGKNMLIVESLADGRRSPAYAHDKVVSLGDISIYTLADDKPLSEVLEALKTKAAGETVDLKALGGDAAVREYFGEVLPEFDRERVNTSDIKKLIKWYNLLIGAGISEFTKTDEAAAEENEETPE
ncbi:MAG: DUF5606 domain-containing protein [Bacteroides sp.]|nr:DUF5606 domain-containing protein [Bacteroides sp.]